MATKAPEPFFATFAPSSLRLREGLLFKRGKVNKSWKRRFFVMNRAFKLNYYETKKKSIETFTVNNDRNLLGSICLLQIQKIEVSAIGNVTFASIPKYIQIASQHADKDDHRSYLINIVTDHRTYHLSAIDSHSFIHWLECFHQYLYAGIKFESYLDKKGEVNKAFKTRYFTLNRWKHLKYYSDDERKIMHGVIDLNDASFKLKVEATNEHFVNNSAIKISSPKRTYILCAKDAELAQEWIDILSNLDELEDAKKKKYSIILEEEEVAIVENRVEEKEIERIPGEILMEWFRAQEEIELLRQPIICLSNGVRLQKLGKNRRHKTTVQDIQMLLDVRCLSPNRLHTYGSNDDHFDFTDNEMSDDELEDASNESSNSDKYMQ